MIDYDAIYQGLIDVARDNVGSYLSTIGSGNWPAVIKARANAPTPDYPYIVVDIISTTQTSGYELGHGVDENDEVYSETYYKLLAQYTVYGVDPNTKATAQQIAHELESCFRFNSVRDTFENSTEAALEETFAVTSIPQKLATEFLEVAAFNLTINVNDRSSNSNDGIFDTINITGEILRNPDDPDPLLFSVSETSNP